MIIQSNIQVASTREFIRFFFAGNSILSVYNSYVKEWLHMHCRKGKFSGKEMYKISACLSRKDHFQPHEMYKILGYDLNKNIFYKNSEIEQMPFEAKINLITNTEFVLKEIFQASDLSENLFMFRSAHCCRCGKPLTEPESIQSGFGHGCLIKVSKKPFWWQKKMF